jgi:hypothetical protein
MQKFCAFWKHNNFYFLFLNKKRSKRENRKASWQRGKPSVNAVDFWF